MATQQHTTNYVKEKCDNQFPVPLKTNHRPKSGVTTNIWHNKTTAKEKGNFEQNKKTFHTKYDDIQVTESLKKLQPLKFKEIQLTKYAFP